MSQVNRTVESGLESSLFDGMFAISAKPLVLPNRGDRIRTCDLVVPNHALYQAELRPGIRPLACCRRDGDVINAGFDMPAGFGMLQRVNQPVASFGFYFGWRFYRPDRIAC
jgi:hypothetical protein